MIAQHGDQHNIGMARFGRVPFHIKVVDTDEAIAFVFRGGFLYVNKGLILESDSESELAAAMAREIAHVCARHDTRLQSEKQYLQLATPPVPAAGQASPTAIQNNTSLGLNLDNAAWSCLNHGDGADLSGFIKNLCHPEFLSHHSFAHSRNSSFQRALAARGLQLDFHVHPGGKIQLHQGIHSLRGGFQNIHQPFVRPDLKLLP